MPAHAPVTEPNAAPDAPAPGAAGPTDPRARKQVEAARAVAFHLLKGVKMIGMYRHNETRYGEYLTKAWEALRLYTVDFGPLALRVELTNFTLLGQELFSEDNPIPYKFFKDGIRQLIFREDFTLEELTLFTLIALSEPDRGADDLNTQLWRAQLPNFEYIMVEGFRMEEASEEEVQVEVDRVVDYLQRRLRTNSDDYVRFARVSEEDLEMQMNDVDQMRGVVITGVTATPELKARLQREIEEEETQRLFPKVISAIFQVVENGVTDAALLSDMFNQLLDAMLLQEDFAIINQAVLKLKAMEQRAGPGSPVGELLRGFVARMGDEQRLSRIGDILKFSRMKSAPEVVRYLTTLDIAAAVPLLDTLEVVELPENRALLCDVLVSFARQNPTPFVERLALTVQPQLQRDLVAVLDRANHPDKLKFFATALKSPNVALRLDVMTIVAHGRTGEARKMIAALLEDDAPQVRLLAARLLPEFDREKAYADLLRVARDKRFEERKPEEREGFYVAIGSTGVPGALTLFTEVLQQKSGLFNKQKVIADKILAVAGLGGACTIQTARMLQEVAEDGAQPTEVKAAARMHLARVRKQLFGGAEKEA